MWRLNRLVLLKMYWLQTITNFDTKHMYIVKNTTIHFIHDYNYIVSVHEAVI